MRVKLLTEAKTAQAYPLVQLLQPNLSLEAWDQFTASHFGTIEAGERGIFTVEDDRGCILALLAYTIDPDLCHRRVLIVKDVIAVTPLDRLKELALSALFEAIEDLAKEKRCLAVRTRIIESESRGKAEALRVSLLSQGHEHDHVVLRKTLADAV